MLGSPGRGGEAKNKLNEPVLTRSLHYTTPLAFLTIDKPGITIRLFTGEETESLQPESRAVIVEDPHSCPAIPDGQR
jgi:hypothetical protein